MNIETIPSSLNINVQDFIPGKSWNEAGILNFFQQQMPELVQLWNRNAPKITSISESLESIGEYKESLEEDIESVQRAKQEVQTAQESVLATYAAAQAIASNLSAYNLPTDLTYKRGQFLTVNADDTGYTFVNPSSLGVSPHSNFYAQPDSYGKFLTYDGFLKQLDPIAEYTFLKNMRAIKILPDTTLPLPCAVVSALGGWYHLIFSGSTVSYKTQDFSVFTKVILPSAMTFHSYEPINGVLISDTKMYIYQPSSNTISSYNPPSGYTFLALTSNAGEAHVSLAPVTFSEQNLFKYMKINLSTGALTLVSEGGHAGQIDRPLVPTNGKYIYSIDIGSKRVLRQNYLEEQLSFYPKLFDVSPNGENWVVVSSDHRTYLYKKGGRTITKTHDVDITHILALNHGVLINGRTYCSYYNNTRVDINKLQQNNYQVLNIFNSVAPLDKTVIIAADGYIYV